MPSGRRCFLCNNKPPTALHLFPKDPTSLGMWKQICNLQEYDDVSRLLICSYHFTSEDYLEPNARNIGGRVRLKPGIFPSVSVPNRIERAEQLEMSSISTQQEVVIGLSEETAAIPEQSSVVFKMEPIIPKAEPIIPIAEASAIPARSDENESDDSLPVTPKKGRFHDARYFGEVISKDFATPRRAKRAMMLAEEQIKKQRLRNRALEQKNRRLRRKVTSLQERIQHLTGKNVLPEDASDVMLNQHTKVTYRRM